MFDESKFDTENPDASTNGRHTMIRLDHLTRMFGDTIAVNKVSLCVPQGQICGYLGPNGAGKSTTVKLLTGILPPTEGSAAIAGFDIVKSPVDVKKRIGVVPESGALYQSLTPFEYLQFVGRLYHMENALLDKRIREFGAFFRLSDHLDQPMHEFSKGMKQKVVLLSALIHNPRVIFLDEPLNGLDANAALLLKQLLRHLADQGKTIFYCSHILEVVEKLCDRVVIIDKGRIIADGSVDDLKSMTKQSSLEAVFNELTDNSDTTGMAKALSQTINESLPEL